MKFLLIKNRNDGHAANVDIEADGFDSAIKEAVSYVFDYESWPGEAEDSGLDTVVLLQVSGIVDMNPVLDKERDRIDSENTRSEATERAEYERLRAKFEPKKYP